MKKVQHILILLVIIFFCISFYGCTKAANGDQAYFYKRPAFGFTVEKAVTTDVNIHKQSSLSIDAQDGMIQITYWDEDYLKIIEKRRLKGPAVKESLKLLLENNKYKVQSTTFDIKLEKEPDNNLKPFFRRTDYINKLKQQIPVNKPFIQLYIMAVPKNN